MINSPFRNDGNFSMMRLCQFICVICSVIVALLVVILDRDLAGGAALIASILTPAFIGKAAQYFGESDFEKKPMGTLGSNNKGVKDECL